jgi:hypothetical protein
VTGPDGPGAGVGWLAAGRGYGYGRPTLPGHLGEVRRADAPVGCRRRKWRRHEPDQEGPRPGQGTRAERGPAGGHGRLGGAVVGCGHRGGVDAGAEVGAPEASAWRSRRRAWNGIANRYGGPRAGRGQIGSGARSEGDVAERVGHIIFGQRRIGWVLADCVDSASRDDRRWSAAPRCERAGSALGRARALRGGPSVLVRAGGGAARRARDVQSPG